MSQLVHDYAFLLDRVMNFRVSVEWLKKQERVDRPEGGKPSSKHVPSGSCRVYLEPSGVLPISPPTSPNESYPEVIDRRAAEMKRALQGAIQPVCASIGVELRKLLASAQTPEETRAAVSLSVVYRSLSEFTVVATYPSGDSTLGSLSLSGGVIFDQYQSLYRQPLVDVLNQVLDKPRAEAIEVVRGMALRAMGDK